MNIRWVLLADFLSNLSDWLVVLSARLYGMPAYTEAELDKMCFSTRTSIELRIKHPCPVCHGDKLIATETGDDWFTCPTCKGMGVDMAYLTQKV